MNSAADGPAVLMVSADRALVDHVLLVAASVGCVPRVVERAEAAGVGWASSRLVLLGADVEPSTLPGRRDAVVLLGLDHGPPPVTAAAATGAERVLSLPSGGQALARLLAAAAADPGRAGLVLGVISARGGAGGTTFAAALASARSPAFLVDGDPAGCGIQVPLGCEGVPGLRWPDLWEVCGPLRPGVLQGSLPEVAGISVLSCTAAGEGGAGLGLVPLEALTSVLAAARQELGLTVLDLPRRRDTAAVLRWRLLDAVVLLVPDEVPAALAGRALARELGATVGQVHVVVRTTRGPGLGRAAVEDAIGVAAQAQWGDQRGVAQSADDGDLLWRVGSGGSARAANQVLEAVEATVADSTRSSAA